MKKNGRVKGASDKKKRKQRHLSDVHRERIRETLLQENKKKKSQQRDGRMRKSKRIKHFFLLHFMEKSLHHMHKETCRSVPRQIQTVKTRSNRS